MKTPLRFLTATALLLGGAAVQFAAADPAAPKKIREPAVAGLFYPKDPAELARLIDRQLAAAKDAATADNLKLKALICPHAGYVYSGPIAASAFRLLQGASFETVFVLAPAHYAALRAASVSDADVFRTPLGDVPIAPVARRLAQSPPFALEPRCYVQRPDWAPQSSRPLPARGTDTADTWEHSDEVEVPFLQRTLKNFSLVPVVFGDVDPAAAARVLAPLLDERSLIVASSDLSHYHPYAEARTLDTRTIEAICALYAERIESEDACGFMPVRTLLHLAKQKGWRPRVLDYRNSGDTAGDKSRVVGYAAIAFYAPAPAATSTLTPEQRRFLLALARRTLSEVTTNGRLPAVSAEGLDEKLTAVRGCFITLTQRGALRGCIGHIEPQMPLYRAVVDNARNAAIRDPRFLPVSAREAAGLEIEISVLTVPQPLAFSSPDDLLRKLHPHEDGVVLTIDGRSATYLPQVWEQLPDKVEFLNNLAEKAGGAPRDWRKPGATISIYHVESFKETGM